MKTGFVLTAAIGLLVACGPRPGEEPPHSHPGGAGASLDSAEVERTLMSVADEGKWQAIVDKCAETRVRGPVLRAVALVLARIGATPLPGRASSGVRPDLTPIELEVVHIRSRCMEIVRTCLPESLDLLPILVQCECTQRDASPLPTFDWMAVAVRSHDEAAPRLMALLDSWSPRVREVCLHTLIRAWEEQGEAGAKIADLLRLERGDDRDTKYLLRAMERVGVKRPEDREFLREKLSSGWDVEAKDRIRRILGE